MSSGGRHRIALADLLDGPSHIPNFSEAKPVWTRTQSPVGVPGQSCNRFSPVNCSSFSPSCRRWKAGIAYLLLLFSPEIAEVFPSFGHLSLNCPRKVRGNFSSPAGSAIGVDSHRRTAIGTSGLPELVQIFP